MFSEKWPKNSKMLQCLLIEKIWGMDYDGFDRTVDVHVKRVRENLGHLPGFKVVTVRGLGYKIEVE